MHPSRSPLSQDLVNDVGPGDLPRQCDGVKNVHDLPGRETAQFDDIVRHWVSQTHPAKNDHRAGGTRTGGGMRGSRGSCSCAVLCFEEIRQLLNRLVARRDRLPATDPYYGEVIDICAAGDGRPLAFRLNQPSLHPLQHRIRIHEA